jgi:hypothetical protein
MSERDLYLEKKRDVFKSWDDALREWIVWIEAEMKKAFPDKDQRKEGEQSLP